MTKNQINSLPLTEKDKESLLIKFSSQTDTQRIRRSTYTQNNAELFRDFFDTIIRDSQERELPYTEFPNHTKESVYQKFTDALRWLCDNDPLKSKYQELRNNYHCRRTQRSLIFIKAGGRVTGIKALGRPVSSKEFHGEVVDTDTVKREQQKILDGIEVVIPSWRNQLIQWIEQGEYNKVHTIVCQEPLSDDDHIWIKTTISGLSGIDVGTNGNTLLCYKEQSV